MSLDQYQTVDLLAVLLEVIKSEAAGRPRMIKFRNEDQKRVLDSFGAEEMERLANQPATWDWARWMSQGKRELMIAQINAELDARELDDLLAKLRPRRYKNQTRRIL